jgi:hypothetical protein
VRTNEPDQPDPTQPEFGPWGPNTTQLNPNLDPGGPTGPKIGFKLGSFGFIKHILGLKPNLRPTRTNWTRSSILRTNPTRLNPNFGSQIRFKWVEFGQTDSWFLTFTHALKKLFIGQGMDSKSVQYLCNRQWHYSHHLDRTHSIYKRTKISSLEINIFDLKVMVKSYLDFFFWNLASPFRVTAAQYKTNQPKKAELAWPVTRYDTEFQNEKDSKITFHHHF